MVGDEIGLVCCMLSGGREESTRRCSRYKGADGGVSKTKKNKKKVDVEKPSLVGVVKFLLFSQRIASILSRCFAPRGKEWTDISLMISWRGSGGCRRGGRSRWERSATCHYRFEDVNSN